MIWDTIANFPARQLLAFLAQLTRPEFGPIWQQMLGFGLIFMAWGTLVGIVGGDAGQVIGKRLGIVNRIAAAMFAGLALRLVSK